MGHKGSIDTVYTPNKRTLPEPLIQEMRDAFRRAESLLDLEGFHEDPAEKQRRQIQAKGLRTQTRSVRQSPRADPSNQWENNLTQKVVTVEEAESLIERDWRFVGTSPNGKVVLERVFGT